MQLLADYWAVFPVFGWLVGGLAGLWLVCGSFDWFVNGVGGLWVVWMVCG